MITPDRLHGEAGAVTLTSHPAMSVIALSGAIDEAAIDELRVAVRWAADRALPVRIEVSPQTALTGGAAEVLAQLSSREQRRGRSLVVVGATAELRQALTDSGLHRLMIFDDGTTADP